jgi:hypothetical protein
LPYVTQGNNMLAASKEIGLAACTDETKCMFRSCQNNVGQNHNVRTAYKS